MVRLKERRWSTWRVHWAYVDLNWNFCADLRRYYQNESGNYPLLHTSFYWRETLISYFFLRRQSNSTNKLACIWVISQICSGIIWEVTPLVRDKLTIYIFFVFGFHLITLFSDKNVLFFLPNKRLFERKKKLVLNSKGFCFVVVKKKLIQLRMYLHIVTDLQGKKSWPQIWRSVICFILEKKRNERENSSPS
jgi:hypothetical protein